MRRGSRRQFLRAVPGSLLTGATLVGATAPASAVTTRAPHGARHTVATAGQTTDGQQSLAVQWRRTYGDRGLDAIRSVAELDSGDLVLAGFTEPASTRGREAWVARTDSDGQLRWERRLGAALATSVLDVVLAGDDTIVVGGTTTTATGQSDGWVAKLARDGQTVWANRYTVGDRDVGTAVSVADAEGGVVLAGGTHSFDTQRQRAWLLRVDTDGTTVWQRRYGDGDTGAHDCYRTPDGEYVLGGATVVDGGTTGGWLHGVDARGNTRWSTIYDETAGGTVERVLPTADGGYLLTGGSLSADGNQDGWITRLDSDRDVVWQRTVGGDRGDYAWAALEYGDGYLVAGFTESTGTADMDAWVLRLDREGNREWTTTVGGPARDFVSTLVATVDGSYLLGGDTASTDDGDQQGWLLKLAPATASSADESAPAGATGSQNTTTSESTTPSGDAGGTGETPGTERTTAASGDGFGIASAAVAVIGAGLAIARRRRSVD